mmetsp:Transcript_22847/g.44421  ORF Transcript_22847/g.44421 Transcript_22847/m.44421 type:complete len:275 (-) Transcript_22847:273-1097(-)
MTLTPKMAVFEHLSADAGLIASVLSTIELLEWCRVKVCSPWMRSAMCDVEPVLRERLLLTERCQGSPFELCKQDDVTGLWAVMSGTEDLKVHRFASNGDTLLHYALAFNGKVRAPKVLAWLLTRSDAPAAAQLVNCRGQGVLHYCARYGQASAAQHLVKMHDVGLEARDNWESTPLIDAVREEHPDVVQLLLNARANPNAFVANCHGDGDTPLILAVRLKNVQIVRQLLAAPGIDVHQKSLIGVPFSKEAMDFAPPRGELRSLLEAACGARRSN